MKRFRLSSLRVFIVLLLAVFVTNTVYATGVMTSKPFEQRQIERIQTKRLHSLQHEAHADSHAQDTAHCHNQDKSVDQHDDVHSRCNQCHHCFACFSALPQLPLGVAVIKPEMVLAINFSPIYLSPVTTQPQKPPIV